MMMIADGVPHHRHLLRNVHVTFFAFPAERCGHTLHEVRPHQAERGGDRVAVSEVFGFEA